MSKTQLKLEKCDINSCKGMCCYDGIYLMEGEENYLKKIVKEYKEYFHFLPNDFIIDGNWKNLVKGRKTATKKFNNISNNYPSHFEKTICIFADNEGKCSLQKLALKLKIHKWTFKPTGCWMFPLRLVNEKIVLPPLNQKDDPYLIDDTYPDFITYTNCGKHNEDGEKYDIALKEEIELINQLPFLPYWSSLNLDIKEIVQKNNLLLDFSNIDN